MTTVKITFESGLLTHRLITDFVLNAKFRGLGVVHEHDKGWLTRNHLVTLTGDIAIIKAWNDACQITINRMNEE